MMDKLFIYLRFVKIIFTLLLSLLISIAAFCQSAVDSFFNIKTQKPPENWVELIQQHRWTPYKDVMLDSKKVASVHDVDREVVDTYWKFDSSKITFGITKTISCTVVYHAAQNTLDYYLPGVENAEVPNSFTVISVSDRYLAMEWIHPKDFYDYRIQGN